VGLGVLDFGFSSILKERVLLASRLLPLKLTLTGKNTLSAHALLSFFGDARREELLIRAEIGRARTIVIVTDSDSHNVSIAFDAYRMNPKIRIIMRLHHDDLGQHLKEQLPFLEIWNPTSLATPVFIRSSLGENIVGDIQVLKSIYLIKEIKVDAHPSSSHSNKLKRSTILCGILKSGEILGPDQIQKTDADKIRAFLVLTASPRDELKFSPISKKLKASILGWPKNLKQMTRNIIENFRDIPPQIKLLFACIALVFVASTMIFKQHLLLSTIDSIYFVVTVMTTTGFGDINLANASPKIKIFGALLMVFSLLMMAGLISFINDRMISARIRNMVGLRLSLSKSHIIVSGLGPLGYEIVKGLLDLGESVVAISDGSKDSYTDDVKNLIPVINGRELDRELLEKAHIESAKAVIIVSQNEIRNLSDGLSAKKANQGSRVIVRTLDIQLAKKMNDSLPIDQVLSDSEVSATNFVASILLNDVLIGFEWNDHLLVLSSNLPNSNFYEIEVPHVKKAIYLTKWQLQKKLT
jgi:Trk K+ transport system NAD-binding subunit